MIGRTTSSAMMLYGGESFQPISPSLIFYNVHLCTCKTSSDHPGPVFVRTQNTARGAATAWQVFGGNYTQTVQFMPVSCRQKNTILSVLFD
jgi:hypothetical protein